MFQIKRDTPHGSRYAIIINSDGISTVFQRKSVNGGYYTRDGVTFPWPWKEVS